MTALFGCVGPGAAIASLRQAGASLLHVPWQQAGILPLSEKVGVGAVWMANRPDLLSIQQLPSRTIVLAGRLLIGGQAMEAAAIAKRMQRDGWDCVTGADGTYLLLVHDRKSRTLDLLADPFASVPLCYGTGEHGFAFGPDGKTVLALAGREPQMDRDSARQFLLNRYLIGDRLMLSGVQRLPPGHRLTFRLDEKGVQLRRVWDLHYSSGIRQIADAEAMLHAALTASHQAMADELGREGRYQMFLTGGLDSRTVLGYARALDKLPGCALTWGARASVPDSDVRLASQLAAAAAVPHAFVPIRAEGWCSHAAEWARISELDSDNASSFATGAAWLDSWGTPEAGFVVLGDQMIGAGPIPANTAQATDNILRSARQALTGPLRGLLGEDSRAAAAEQFRSVIAHLIDDGPNDHPKDIQDYLYFHTYIARWILAPGNFKAPVFNVRRPLMTRAVMDAVSRFTPALRVDKAVLVHLLQRRFPDLMAVPKTAADSNVPWRQVLRSSQELAECVRNGVMRLAEDDSPLRQDINGDGLLAFVGAFFSMADGPSSGATVSRRKDRLRRMAYELRGAFSRLPGMDGALRAAQPMVKRLLGMTRQEDVAVTHQVLMRLALLGIMQQGIADGEFSRAPVGALLQRVQMLESPRACHA